MWHQMYSRDTDCHIIQNIIIYSINLKILVLHCVIFAALDVDLNVLMEFRL